MLPASHPAQNDHLLCTSARISIDKLLDTDIRPNAYNTTGRFGPTSSRGSGRIVVRKLYWLGCLSATHSNGSYSVAPSLLLAPNYPSAKHCPVNLKPLRYTPFKLNTDRPFWRRRKVDRYDHVSGLVYTPFLDMTVTYRVRPLLLINQTRPVSATDGCNARFCNIRQKITLVI
jgi:hypothetical protein